MARKAQVEEVEDIEVQEPTVEGIIKYAISLVIEDQGLDGQKARYKAMRAMAYVAMSKIIDTEGNLDGLVQETLDSVDDLPYGWTLEKMAKADAAPDKLTTAAKTPAKKAPVRKAPAKRGATATTAKNAPAKATPRKRPARKATA